MESSKMKFPMEIENFEEIRMEGFYYVDKTGLIKELLTHWAKANLIIRPRRFGRTLNMSMLKTFFGLDGNKEVFKETEIAKEVSLCEEYMGKFPVISISMRNINARTYEVARDIAVATVNEVARKFQYLLDSERLTAYEQEKYTALLRPDMSEAVLYNSLKLLTILLEKHHGRKVILLLDEYDVPLEKAFEKGYYEQMATLIHNLLGQALKTNDSLEFSVLTGCMPISNKSIFTGLNNLRVFSGLDMELGRYFGFTDQEVRKLLEYYNLSQRYESVREWYGGYQFGNTEMYCPCDVIDYCDALRVDCDAQPQNYGVSTIGNDTVRRLIRESSKSTIQHEIERLVAGEIIEKELRQDLTCEEIYSSNNQIWSVLFLIGYLTQRGRPEGRRYRLAIPNLAVRDIFTRQIRETFKESIPKNGDIVDSFCNALKNGDADEVEKRFSEYMRKTISVKNTFAEKPLKENFYHSILLGLLRYWDIWGIFSEEESEDGYSNILVRSDDEEIGIVIGVKCVEDGRLEEACKEALEQIESRRHEEELQEEGIRHILKYGIACCKRRCKVLIADAGQLESLEETRCRIL